LLSTKRLFPGFEDKGFYKVEKGYRNYTVEDFASDLDFINWVKKGTDTRKWEALEEENPHSSRKIKIARKIILALHTPETSVGQDEVYTLWKNVELFYQLHHQSNRKKRLIRFAQYAAVFLIAFFIGAAIPILYFTHDDQEAHHAAEPFLTNELAAKLVLAGGEEVILRGKRSELAFDASGRQIKIGQDSVVHYSGKMEQHAMARLIVPFGMRSGICLSDGTSVWLNAGSMLSFPQKFAGKNRKVFLKGEAFFKVAKNEESPFIVCSDNLNVRVLGTAFNMRDDELDKESAEVVLVEGSVSLQRNGWFNLPVNEIQLKPNQKATYWKSDKKTTVDSDIETVYYTSWKEGFLEFNKTGILTVFNRLSRFYHVEFVVEKKVKTTSFFSGKLDLDKPLTSVLETISGAAPVNCRIEGRRVYVNQK